MTVKTFYIQILVFIHSNIFTAILMKGVSKISHAWCELYVKESIMGKYIIYKTVRTIKTCNFNSLYTHHGGKCNNEFLWKQTSWCPKCLLIPKNKNNLLCYIKKKKNYHDDHIKSRVCVWDCLFQVPNCNQWVTTLR